MRRISILAASVAAAVGLFGVTVAAVQVAAPAPVVHHESVTLVAPPPVGLVQTATGSVAPPGWGKPVPISPALRRLARAVARSSTATMWDSIDLTQIPSNPFSIAGYTSGSWPTYLPMRHQWPTAHTISIAVTPIFHADCLDVEPGDANPSDAPGWWRADHAAGFAKPCIYSSLWEYQNQVIPALSAAGISRSQYWAWDADYRGCNGTIDQGFDATQCTDHALGRNLDESVVSTAFLSIAQPPLGHNPPPPQAPVCFGKGAQTSNSTCKRVRAEVTGWQQERYHLGRVGVSVTANSTGERCVSPFKRTSCVTFAHVQGELATAASTLAGQIKATEAKYS